MKKKNLFRRICRLGAWCALSGMLMFAACTDEAATGLPAEGAAIRFDVGLSETWESGGSAPAEASEAERADTLVGRGAEVPIRSRSTASNISVTVVDGLPPRTRTAYPQTRGAQKNTSTSLSDYCGNPGTFGMLASVLDNGSEDWVPYISNTEMNLDGSLADGSNVYWPGTWRDCSIRFYAYAPYSYADNDNSDGTEGGIPYTNPSDADEQIDFLVAATDAYESGDYPEEVPLTFTHALTAVAFKFSFTDLNKEDYPSQITGITINNVGMAGTYSVAYGESEGKWAISEGGREATLTISDNSKCSEVVNYKECHWPLNFYDPPVDYFLMIPQSMNGISLTVFYNDESGDKSIYNVSYDYEELEWKPGTTVVYNATINPEVIEH